MTNNPTDHELSIQRLTKTSVERQRELNGYGWVFDIFGNCAVGHPTYLAPTDVNMPLTMFDSRSRVRVS